jgi:hypothetical protein
MNQPKSKSKKQNIKGLMPHPRDHFLSFGYDDIGQGIVRQVIEGRPRPFLLIGPKGCGKRTLSYRLSLDLLALGHREPLSFLQQKLRAQTHRDFFVLENRQGSVGVEDCRALKDFLASHSFYPKGLRVVLLDQLHLWNAHCLNSLLKNLEEPWERVVFLLTSDEPVLPTIASRCQQYFLEPLEEEVFYVSLESYLQHSLGLFEGNPSAKKTWASLRGQLNAWNGQSRSFKSDFLEEGKNPLDVFLAGGEMHPKELFWVAQGALGKAIGWLWEGQRNFALSFFQWTKACQQKTPIALELRRTLVESPYQWAHWLWSYLEGLIIESAKELDRSAVNQPYHSLCQAQERLEKLIKIYEIWKAQCHQFSLYHVSMASFFDHVSLTLRQL